MSNLNDTSMNPQGVQGAYAGVANPTSSSMPKASDAYATEGDLSGPQTDESSSGQGSSAKGNEPVRDVIEAEPGIIETTELAPIGDKIAPDPTLLSQATAAGKKIYNSVVGESEQ